MVDIGIAAEDEAHKSFGEVLEDVGLLAVVLVGSAIEDTAVVEGHNKYWGHIAADAAAVAAVVAGTAAGADQVFAAARSVGGISAEIAVASGSVARVGHEVADNS